VSGGNSAQLGMVGSRQQSAAREEDCHHAESLNILTLKA
jgi:hypothetical protein